MLWLMKMTFVWSDDSSNSNSTDENVGMYWLLLFDAINMPSATRHIFTSVNSLTNKQMWIEWSCLNINCLGRYQAILIKIKIERAVTKADFLWPEFEDISTMCVCKSMTKIMLFDSVWLFYLDPLLIISISEEQKLSLI